MRIPGYCAVLASLVFVRLHELVSNSGTVFQVQVRSVCVGPPFDVFQNVGSEFLNNEDRDTIHVEHVGGRTRDVESLNFSTGLRKHLRQWFAVPWLRAERVRPFHQQTGVVKINNSLR